MIRDLVPADVPSVIALFQRSVHRLTTGEYSPEERAVWAPAKPAEEVWCERLSSGGVFVDEEGGRLRGFGRIAGDGHIDLLFVDPDHVRRGVGKALLERMVLWARERRLTRLTTDASKTARPFFERHGFRVERKQVVEREGVCLENWRMVRPLAPG